MKYLNPLKWRPKKDGMDRMLNKMPGMMMSMMMMKSMLNVLAFYVFTVLRWRLLVNSDGENDGRNGRSDESYDDAHDDANDDEHDAWNGRNGRDGNDEPHDDGWYARNGWWNGNGYVFDCSNSYIPLTMANSIDPL